MVDEFIAQIAGLIAAALEAARAEGRLEGLQQAVQICEQLARGPEWEQILGAAECANRIRSKIKAMRVKVSETDIDP